MEENEYAINQDELKHVQSLDEGWITKVADETESSGGQTKWFNASKTNRRITINVHQLLDSVDRSRKAHFTAIWLDERFGPARKWRKHREICLIVNDFQPYTE